MPQHHTITTNYDTTTVFTSLGSNSPMALAKLPEVINGLKSPSFCYTTITERWPKIVTRIVDQFHKYQREAVQLYGEEGDADVKSIIAKLSQLKYLIGTDKPLQDVDPTPESQPNDAGWWNAKLDAYRSQLADPEQASWFTLPWLFTECYLYRQIWAFLQATRHLRLYDPFHAEKEKAYWDSVPHLLTIGRQVTEAMSGDGCRDVEKILLELLQIEIWGNKCDLSLSGGDPHFMSDTLFHELEQLRPNILADDLDKAVQYTTSKGSPQWQLDVVLDNAGLEVFTDLCLADFLLHAKLAGRVIFHGKAMPWFVSDVTKTDMDWVLAQMMASEGKENSVLRELGTRWKDYFNSGKFAYEAHPFWTLGVPYCEMATEAPGLYAQLQRSNFIILKGDLNYRKLVGDRYWPLETPFKDAICGFEPAPLLVLRTLKAETCSGLPLSAIHLLEKKFGCDSKEWMVSSEYAVAQIFLP